MIKLFNETRDGRLHLAHVERCGPGRPPDLTKPYALLRKGVLAKLKKIELRMAHQEREYRKWLEVLEGLPTSAGTGNGHTAA
jgi:hypothetical protein